MGRKTIMIPLIPAVLRIRADEFPPKFGTHPGPTGLELRGPIKEPLVFTGLDAEDQARKRAWELHDGNTSQEEAC